MARRTRRKARRKSPKTVSLWNLGVGWIYVTALSKMATGAGPVEFVLGPGDIQAQSQASTLQGLGINPYGAGMNYGGR